MNIKSVDKLDYPIIISDSFNELFDKFSEVLKTKKVLIITDSNVVNLYADEIADIFKKNNISAYKYIIESGEKSKNLDVIYDIYNKCLELNLDRNSCLIALGGGVVGDITGFVASTFMRGINYIQIPTTVISQVDSSIGGKTGVDLKGYKNIIGSFYNPKLVYTNVATLATLENRQYISGISEVIKYGIIEDEELFELIESNVDSLLLKETEILRKVIYRCCDIKSEIVKIDEKETGIRAVLNFGHTIGHAIESASNFELLHGESIAIGILAANKLALKLGKFTESEYNRIYNLFDRLSLLRNIKNIKIGKILEYLKHDKKIVDSKIKFIIPSKIGETEIIKDIDENILVEILIEMGLRLNY